jgi:hypothetical protein
MSSALYRSTTRIESCDAVRLETRYRFFDEGTLPIDIAVSGEVNTHRDEHGHQIQVLLPRQIA